MKYILAILILTGCYNNKKAMQQFSRAAIYDPAIGVNYCARNYGCDTVGRDSIIYISDSAAFNSALQMVTEENARMNAIVDSLLSIEPPEPTDTNCFAIIDVIRKQNEILKYKLAHFPAIHDTVKIPGPTVVDKAALAACLIDNQKLIANLAPITADRDRFKKRSKTYLWLLVVAGFIVGLSAYFKIKGIFTPKLKAV